MTEDRPSRAPDLSEVSAALLMQALARGWSDLRRAPVFAMAVAGVYVLAGWGMLWITHATGQDYWWVLAVFGFPLFAPFAAVTFYDISRRLEQGKPLIWGDILSVVLRQSRGQLPSMGVVIMIVLLFWFFLGHMIFALFLGLSPMTEVSTSYAIYMTPNGLMMLGVGGAVGAAFATLLFMITVLSLPMLLDRDIDFMTAMIRSFGYVRAHPVPMLLWGGFIAAVLLVSMLPLFVGLFVTLPLFGHTTWHVYDMLATGAAAPAAGVDHAKA